MEAVVISFLLSLVCGTVFTPLAIRLARRVGAIDYALSSRKIHKAPIPRLGGIAIAAAFFVPLIGLLLLDRDVGRLFHADGLRPLGLFVGGGLIVALGIYDDLKGAGAKAKFSCQFGVAALVYFLGYRIDFIVNPFGAEIDLGWLGLPFTMLWIAGVTNAFNLIDGLDGLAGGVAFVAVGMTFIFGAYQGAPLMMLSSAAMAGAILGFLRYNFNPAKIFMGDTGSMFLGFVLATSSIQAHQKSSTTAVALLVPMIVVLGLPITDTLLSMSRRFMHGAPLFQADRGHIHHKLLDLGLSQRATALTLYAVSITLGAVGFVLATASRLEARLVLGGLVLAAVAALRRLGYFQVERTREVLEQRRRNLVVRRSMDQIGAQLRHADGVGQVWESVKAAVPALGAEAVALHLGENASVVGIRSSRFEHDIDRAAHELLRTRHGLRGERPGRNTIEFAWNHGRTAIDRDTELAVEGLCRHVHSALSRLETSDTLLRGRNEAAVPALGAEAVTLHLDQNASGLRSRLRRFEHNLDQAGALFRTRHAVRGERPGHPAIELAWNHRVAARARRDRMRQVSAERDGEARVDSRPPDLRGPRP
jgi:UDP-GlcNAc:undecaprenyl-phosphate/decaprenyl-phosphate GlcNAc-1-phosphate transferase